MVLLQTGSRRMGVLSVIGTRAVPSRVERMTRRRFRVPAGLLLLLLSVGIAGCGDLKGYSILIQNRSTADVILTFSGNRLSMDDGTTADPRTTAFIMPASQPPSAGPSVESIWSETRHQWLSGEVVILTSDCQPIAVVSVSPGTYVLTIDDGTPPILEPYAGQRFPAGTPILRPVSDPCQNRGTDGSWQVPV